MRGGCWQGKFAPSHVLYWICGVQQEKHTAARVEWCCCARARICSRSVRCLRAPVTSVSLGPFAHRCICKSGPGDGPDDTPVCASCSAVASLKPRSLKTTLLLLPAVHLSASLQPYTAHRPQTMHAPALCNVRVDTHELPHIRHGTCVNTAASSSALPRCCPPFHSAMNRYQLSRDECM